jgi:hypothetical protein
LKYPGIDAAKWEAIVSGHQYTPTWATPAAIMPGDLVHFNKPLDGTQRCAQNSITPDRVIFHGTQWNTGYTMAQWLADWNGIVKNIKTKWPSVRRIELMLSTVGPGDKACPGGNEQTIPALGFQSLDVMQTMGGGLVFEDPGLGQYFEVPNCSDFVPGGPQYANNPMAIMDIVNLFGKFFTTHP